MVAGVLASYHSLIEDGTLQPDVAQGKAVKALADLSDQLVAQRVSKKPFWAFRRSSPEPIKGLYLWGGVGRGKTFLMDLFFNQLQDTPKKRVHFYRFMREVHQELARLQGRTDPLQGVAEKIAREAKVLCFDEFFVSDITDAMILSGILKGLFDQGVTLVATSNLPPQELYKDGLQRRKFLPAIELLESNNQVLNVDSGYDYRMRSLTQAPLYYIGLNPGSEDALRALFHRLTAEDAVHEGSGQGLVVASRTIPALGLAGDVAWFAFEALCDGPRSQNDYIEIAEQFGTVFLSGVPRFSEYQEDQARRFISLVDEFYDRHVKLVLSAEASISELYQGRRLRFEFERTESRLLEMQSTTYIGAQHLI